MNRRTVKRVKDPKACGPCGHCIQEDFGHQRMHRCNVKPIMAKEENNCEQCIPPTIDEED